MKSKFLELLTKTHFTYLLIFRKKLSIQFQHFSEVVSFNFIRCLIYALTSVEVLLIYS